MKKCGVEKDEVAALVHPSLIHLVHGSYDSNHCSSRSHSMLLLCWRSSAAATEWCWWRWSSWRWLRLWWWRRFLCPNILYRNYTYFSNCYGKKEKNFIYFFKHSSSCSLLHSPNFHEYQPFSFYLKISYLASSFLAPSIRNKVNIIRTQGTQRMLSSTAQWIILYFFPSRLSFWTTQVLSWKKSQLKWKNAKKMYE